MKTLLALALLLMSFNAFANCEGYRPFHSKGTMATPQHESCNCESCHNNGIYVGTPVTACADCHVAGGRASQFKSAQHIPTSAACDSCHKTTAFAWQPASMNHNATTLSCETCHNGNFRSSGAEGKHSKHIPTTATCSTCHHSTSNWDSSFSHQGVTAGSCLACHNDSFARGKPTVHIPTTLSCDTCHSGYGSFTGATMNHVGITGGCETCHNGILAKGKSANHPTTPAACTTCHLTTSTFKCGSLEKPYTFAKYNYRKDAEVCS
jgi:Cytochrome c7 and related cytochrome c